MRRRLEYLPNLLQVHGCPNCRGQDTWSNKGSRVCGHYSSHSPSVFHPPRRQGQDMPRVAECCQPERKGHTEAVTEVGRPLGVCFRAVVAGRPFITAIYSLMKKVKKPEHKVRITGLAKEDIRIWSSFLTSFNGRSFFQQSCADFHLDIHLYTNASTSADFGGCFQKEWIYGGWSGPWLGKDILLCVDRTTLPRMGIWQFWNCTQEGW